MNSTIIKLAAQALLGRRRFWLLLAFPVLLIALTATVAALTDAEAAEMNAIAHPFVADAAPDANDDLVQIDATADGVVFVTINRPEKKNETKGLPGKKALERIAEKKQREEDAAAKAEAAAAAAEAAKNAPAEETAE